MLLVVVVKTTGQDDEGISLERVNQTVILVYAPRPVTLTVILERFGFAQSLVRGADTFSDKAIELFEQFGLVFLKP